MGSRHSGKETRDYQVVELPRVADVDDGAEDRGRPGVRMNPCGSYGGDYNNRKGKVRYIIISDRF